MSTDHRGRPLQSQGGAIPYRNRDLVDYQYDNRDEELDDYRGLMEDAGDVGHRDDSGYSWHEESEPESQSTWNAGMKHFDMPTYLNNRKASGH